MSLHAAAYDALARWQAPTPEQESLRAAYVDHLRARPDGVWRGCFPDHLTASTLVLSDDGERALLQLHAKAGRWFQLGGHLEPGDATLAAAALREATEESGLPDLVLDPVPVQLSRHEVAFCDPRGPVDHLDVRFVARAAAGAEPVLNHESLALRWWPVTGLPTEEADLHELLALGLARVGAVG